MQIVVGYHGTAEGRAAFDRAVEIARERGDELHIVSIVDLPRTETDDPKHYERARAEEEGRLNAVADRLEKDGLRCQAHVPVGALRPAVALLSVARSVAADLIVIGMRKRSRVGKLVLGSTAQEVLLNADCEVLSVKAGERA